MSLKRKNACVLYLLGIIFYLTLNSCYYDVETDLYPNVDCHPTGVRYSADIIPVLNRHCYSCHSFSAQNGNVLLEGYAALIPYIESGALLGSINHGYGWSAMPKDRAKIPTCDIRKVEVWIAEGFLQN